MPRKTLVFGNGVGMAVSPASFSLDGAIDRVWNDEDILSVEERALIRACLPPDFGLDRPSSEEDLDLLQRVLSACDFLGNLDEVDGAHWLSDYGLSFPPAIRRFVHQVAAQFHLTGLQLPQGFSGPLCEFIHGTKSHVATLNYDPLLYDCFIENNVLSGYNGDLIDGIWNQGFARENLFRNRPEQLGWYLHLHGSPLFFDGANGRIRKMRRPQLNNRVVASTHLVLTHVAHKPSIISASTLLSAYWQFFERALSESDEVILFGYSGFDSHVNTLISRSRTHLNIRVIEWEGSQPDDDRPSFWLNKLQKEVELVSLPNILAFNNW